jgi:hypothetical protein
MKMEKEMNFDFDNLEVENEVKTVVLLYAEGEFGEKGELIQRLVVENLANISIDYEKKVFHAEYIGDGRNGIKKGEIFDILFYKMIIV